MTSRIMSISWLTGLLAMLVSAPVSAEGREVRVGSTTRFTSSSSAHAISGGNLSMFTISGGHHLERLRVPGFELLIDGTFEVGGMDGMAFQSLETSTTMALVAMGARLRRDLSRRWIGHVRGNLGGARVSVDIGDRYRDDIDLNDTAYTMTAYLGGGVDVLLARKHRADGAEQVSFGLELELGYMAMVPVTMDATPASGPREDIIRIPEMTASLGSLDTSGWSLRFGLIGRF